jgi:hypothetical protein
VSPPAPGRTLPLPLLVAMIAAGAVAGWVALELVDSTVAAVIVAAVVSWGGVLFARRARAARGRRDSGELVSGDVEVAAGLRSYVTRVVPLFAFLAGFGVIAGLLSALGVEGPELAGLEPSEALAFVLAAPLWLDVDARLSARAARRRGDEASRLRAAADPVRADAARGTTREEWKATSRAARLELREEAGQIAELPAGGWRAWSLALGLVATGLAIVVAVYLDHGLGIIGELVGLATGAGMALLGAMLVRVLVTAPYFLRLTPTGLVLMGAGEVPWEAVRSVDVVADSGLKILNVMLAPEVPRAERWYTDAHARLSRRVGDDGIGATLLFCPRPPEIVLRAIRARSRVLVDVDLDA